MGHDIYAYKEASPLRRDEIAEELDINNYDHPDWSQRYQAYRLRTEAAYLRRSAFDPWNKALYVALGAEDAYAGCSGDGSIQEFDLEQINGALQHIGKLMESPPPKREPNMADGLEAVLTEHLGHEVTLASPKPDPNDNLEDELAFLFRCKRHCEKHGSVSICFS